MKKIAGYYVDDNNNSWSVNGFTAEQAIKYSQTLIFCSGCSDCSNCRNCSDCNNCSYCGNCTDCNNCSYCGNCSDCSTCRDCSCCSNCSDCSCCSNCSDYNDQPQMYCTDKIGRRDDNTRFYYGDTDDGKKLQVVCGCFRGDLEDFTEAVVATHGDNKYARQYKKEIEKVKFLFGEETMEETRKEVISCDSSLCYSNGGCETCPGGKQYAEYGLHDVKIGGRNGTLGFDKSRKIT